ncbi:sensor histidine kinase [Nocardia sp. GAS34]|uniref:sensor histidine kinase n=1 Tax=unclassified Nocardia TaxID=2637762 RepID=UPI003D22D473
MAAIAGAAVAWWRVSPTPALATVFGLYLVDVVVLRVVPAPVFLPLVITFVATVLFGRRWLAHLVLVLGYLVAVSVPVPDWNSPSVISAAGLAAWFLVLSAGTEIVRTRRQARRARAAELVSEAQARQEHALRRAGEERLSIARDLHDVLAHQLALITVQANAGLALLHSDRDGTEQALTAIKAAGNSALGELRSVLDILRAGQAAPISLRSSPQISRAGDLAELLDGARAAGLTVRTDTVGPPAELPGMVGQAAYRIVQEAVTNAIRHAGAGTDLALTLAYRPDRLELTVTDDGAGSPSIRASRGGNGIPGMRERAAALGGTITARPLAGGGYRVAAILPLRKVPTL